MNILSAKPKLGFKRKWRFAPRFRLIDLLWLMVLVGVLASWYRDRDRLHRKYGIVPQIQVGSGWSIDQVLGDPDTAGFGDISTAWASASYDTSEEWLIVEFPRSIAAHEIHIYETFNPGAVVKIDSVDFQGRLTPVWSGNDPIQAGTAGGISKIKLTVPFRTRRIQITIDSQSVPGWNEIDAVGIVDANGKILYTSNSWASSSFGDNRERPKWFWP